MVVLGLHKELDQLENEATPYMGYMGELNIFHQPCENLGVCPWGDRCVGWLVLALSWCSPLKGGSSSLQGSSNSCDAHF